MFVTDVDAAQLEELIEQNAVVLVNLWASRCVSSMQFGLVYEKVAADHPDIVFAQVNLDTESALADVFQIRSIPYLLIFKDKMAVYSKSGSMSDFALRELVEQALKLDLNERGEAK